MTTQQDDIVARLRSECNFSVHGFCQTRACLIRGGWNPKDPLANACVPTCQAKEDAEKIISLRQQLADQAREHETAYRSMADIMSEKLRQVEAERDRLRGLLHVCAEQAANMANQIDPQSYSELGQPQYLQEAFAALTPEKKDD